MEFLRHVLWPLGAVYGGAMAGRNWLYDHGYRQKWKIKKPVISVGNLTVGGTGKTPVAMFIADFLRSKGLKPAVITRGYGGEIVGVEQVDIHHHSASSRYGDEPVLMASLLGGIPVVVGPDRVLAAEKAAESADIIVTDDGFQHRRLIRDLDIVVVDSTQKDWAMRTLPWGLARESWEGLKRAQLVVLSKVNLSDANRVAQWRKVLSEFPGLPVVECSYEAAGLVTMDGRPWQQSVSGWFAISGIGQPKPFQRLLIDELKLNVIRHHWYPDHHAFTEADITALANDLPDSAAIVITEKDAVKWRKSRHPIMSRVAVAKIKLGWPKGNQELERALAAVTR